MRERTEYSGILLVISGSSGSGKDSVADVLQSEGWERVVTYNAGRGPRPGEIEGVHYYFVSEEEFDSMKQRGELLEFVDYAETKKGTGKSEIMSKLSSGKKVIWRIDPTAAANVEQIFTERLGEEAEAVLARTCVVFLRAESDQVLMERAKRRNSKADPAVIKRRIEEDNKLWGELKDQFPNVIINRENALEEAINEIRGIVAGFLV